MNPYNTVPCNGCNMLYVNSYNSNDSERTHNVCGNLPVFNHGLKQYARKCCIMAYNIATTRSELCFNTELRDTLCSKIKLGSPMMCVMTNTFEEFEVYQIKPTFQTKIKANNSTSSGYGKIVHVRRDMINFQASQNTYELMTGAAYTKKKTEKTQAQAQTEQINTGTTDNHDIKALQYVYLLRECQAVKANQCIYKVGKTEKPNMSRFGGYLKGYEILLLLSCDDCHTLEKTIIQAFRDKYKQAYGSEYFEGDQKMMIHDIIELSQY